MTKNETIELGRTKGTAEWARCDMAIIHLESDVVREKVKALAADHGRSEVFRDAFVSAFMQEWHKAHEALPEVQAANRLRMFTWKLDSLTSGADKTLAQFAERLVRNPLDAFQWSDGAIEAAARKDVALYLKNVLEHPEGGLDAAIAKATEMALRGARYPSHSTSAISNLCEQAKTAAFADMAEVR